MRVTIEEAQERLSELIAMVEAGEEVVIVRGEVPVVRLVKIEGDTGEEVTGRRDAGGPG